HVRFIFATVVFWIDEHPNIPAVSVHATKVGRNAPCPCGSGLKYKKCCLGKMENGQSPPPEVIEKARRLLQQKMEANRKWVERYGQVPQPITTENFGKRLIAVRNAIYALDTHEYFGDFLRDYVVIVFGNEWWKGEMAKAEAERHP